MSLIRIPFTGVWLLETIIFLIRATRHRIKAAGLSKALAFFGVIFLLSICGCSSLAVTAGTSAAGHVAMNQLAKDQASERFPVGVNKASEAIRQSFWDMGLRLNTIKWTGERKIFAAGDEVRKLEVAVMAVSADVTEVSVQSSEESLLSDQDTAEVFMNTLRKRLRKE